MWPFTKRAPEVEATEPEPARQYTLGYGCGEHCSTEHNGGICATCGAAVRPAVVRQWWSDGFAVFGGPYIRGRWYGAEFVRWVDTA